MLYPTDFSRHTPMTEEEAVNAIHMAVLLKLRFLRAVKGKSMEDQLRASGINWFAREVAEQLTLSNVALFKGPPSAHHSTHGR